MHSRGIPTQPILYKGLLLFGESEGAFTVADANSGAILGRFFPGDGLVSRPSIQDSSGEAYFISNGANLFAMKIAYKKASEKLPWRESF